MRFRTLDDIMTPMKPASAEEFMALTDEMKKVIRFASSIGLLKHNAPLNPIVFDAAEYHGILVEKVILQTLPGFYLAGNLYRPKDTSKKYPAVLNPHGHWEHGRFEVIDLARIPQRCANLAMRGMVAFVYDMVGYNDSNQVVHSKPDCQNSEYEKWNFNWFSLQLNNSIKALDFVESLPYVDAERIGCTGCSGGGTQTYFLTAIDPRVKAAAPINMASTRMQGGCNCENIPFLRTEFNNVDYTMAAAPRPLFMSASDGDWTVNSETVEFPAIEHVYSLLGVPERYEHFYRKAPHCFELCTRERVYSFFCRAFGIDNPYEHEIDMEFDLNDLRIGNISDYVSQEGYVHNDSEVFELARKLISENLSRLDTAAREELIRRVFALDKSFDLDIPYVYSNQGEENAAISLGTCPAPADTGGVRFVHCYNYAEDTKRVNALAALMRGNPDALFRAQGKTAALCKIAARLSGPVKLELAEADASGVFIPGSMLTGIC